MRRRPSVAIALWLAQKLISPQRRRPDLVVGAEESQHWPVRGEKPYLQRWWLIPRNRFFNVYLHRFLRSDDDRALHDHPWWSFSIMLKGRMLEHTIRDGGVHHRAELTAGCVRFRTARFAHRLELQPSEECWTLFITAPVIRTWGFHCPQGWRHHEEFARTRGGASTTGRGCA